MPTAHGNMAGAAPTAAGRKGWGGAMQRKLQQKWLKKLFPAAQMLPLE